MPKANGMKNLIIQEKVINTKALNYFNKGILTIEGFKRFLPEDEKRKNNRNC